MLIDLAQIGVFWFGFSSARYSGLWSTVRERERITVQCISLDLLTDLLAELGIPWLGFTVPVLRWRRRFY